MKRSDMVKEMTELWLGLFPDENYMDKGLQSIVSENMSKLLKMMEHKGMKAPIKEECPVLLMDTYVWEKE